MTNIPLTRFPIREALPHEIKNVLTLFKKNLSIIDWIPFMLVLWETVKSIPNQSGRVLIVEDTDLVIGSVSLRIFKEAKEAFGLIDAVVIHRNYRGLGIGKSLIDASLTWFAQKGCVNIYATADRYNSPSWNLFLHKEFKVYDIIPQIQDLRVGIHRLWISEGYYLGIGTFFLKKSPGMALNRESKTWIHLFAGILGFSLIWCMSLLRSVHSIEEYAIVAGVVGISAIAHEIMHMITAKLLHHQATFKVWIPGLLFAFLISLLGGIYPSYGSTYVSQLDWSYSHDKRLNGIIYSVEPLTSLILAIGCWCIPLFFPKLVVVSLWDFLFEIGYLVNIIIATINLWPFRTAGGFPWDGVKIYRWNKKIWVTLLIATVGIIITVIFV